MPRRPLSYEEERIVKAWTDMGRKPSYHYRAQESLRDKWPVLARAIEALVYEAERDSPDWLD